MEEILASIRRIISDDEQNPARKPAAAAAPQSHQDDEGLEAVEGEADDRIINDIARVLSGGAANAGAPEAPVEAAMEEEEDILDLTAELGGLEPVEEPMVAEVVEMVEDGRRGRSEPRPIAAEERSRRLRRKSFNRRPQRRKSKPPPAPEPARAGRAAAADVGER